MYLQCREALEVQQTVCRFFLFFSFLFLFSFFFFLFSLLFSFFLPLLCPGRLPQGSDTTRASCPFLHLPQVFKSNPQFMEQAMKANAMA